MGALIVVWHQTDNCSTLPVLNYCTFTSRRVEVYVFWVVWNAALMFVFNKGKSPQKIPTQYLVIILLRHFSRYTYTYTHTHIYIYAHVLICMCMWLISTFTQFMVCALTSKKKKVEYDSSWTCLSFFHLSSKRLPQFWLTGISCQIRKSITVIYLAVSGGILVHPWNSGFCITSQNAPEPFK